MRRLVKTLIIEVFERHRMVSGGARVRIRVLPSAAVAR